MAAPNLAGVTNIRGKVIGLDDVGTSDTVIVTCPVDKVLKINSILAANVDGADSAELTVLVNDNSASLSYSLSNQIPIQGQSSLVILSKDNSIYLEENDTLSASSNNASVLSILVSYDEIGDD